MTYKDGTPMPRVARGSAKLSTNLPTACFNRALDRLVRAENVKRQRERRR